MFSNYFLKFINILLPLFLGSLGTYYLKIQFTAVLASSLASLILIGISRIILRTDKNDSLIFCGSFISMGGIANEEVLFIASIMASITYMFLLNRAIGFGGKLGTVAFIGSAGSLIMGLF